MGIKLIVEVLDHAPLKLTSGERCVLVVIAEWANDKTRIARQTRDWTVETLACRAGLSRAGLKTAIQGLARKGIEVRKQIGKTATGAPVYAFEGSATTFQLPNLVGKRGCCAIPSKCERVCPEPGEGMPQHRRGDAVSPERGCCEHPHPLITPQEPSLRKPLTTSSSRAEARDWPAADRKPVPEQRKKKRRVSSQERAEIRGQEVLTERGYNEAQRRYLIDDMTREHTIYAPGWWDNAIENETLDDRIEESIWQYEADEPWDAFNALADGAEMTSPPVGDFTDPWATTPTGERKEPA